MQLDEAFAKLNIIQDFIPAGNSNRPGTRIAPTKITIHNTDNTSRGANAAAHAKYQKGADARRRNVSWHFTVDDIAAFQSLPANEKGWHTGSAEGNRVSIGIEICMHPEMDVKAGYDRAALLTAVMAQQLEISTANGIVQHHHWSRKHCPRVLRDKPNGWADFLKQVRDYRRALESVPAPRIAFAHDDD
jgi:N-acetylmuramoyl-L-alanine amidase CwlA